MDAPTVARQVAYGRIALGAALAVAPGLVARGWIGSSITSTGTRVLARGFGLRDVAIGAGTLSALEAGRPTRDWLLAGALADVADLTATLAAGRSLPLLGRYG